MKSGVLAVGLLFVSLVGCDRPSTPASSQQTVLVIYTSVDEPYARPILQEFEKQSGIKVEIQTDTEATKSAGLAERLLAERDKPRCDVWWGNEIFHTIRLAKAGVLAPYESPAAKDVPAKFKDATHLWAGCGLRARVLATSGPATGAMSIDELTKPEHKGKVAIARPTAGTTGGHIAAMYVRLGPERFRDFITLLKANEVKLLGGNGPVAEAVGRGEVAVGLTDNDDISAVQRNDGKIVQHLPDQDTIGTLTIPTTVALVAGSKQSDAAKKLVDYLLSPAVEQKLIDAKFAGWSVRADVKDIRTMDIDYAEAAKMLPLAVESAMMILEDRK